MSGEQVKPPTNLAEWLAESPRARRVILSIPMPHRELFLAAWLNPNVTMDALSRRYGVSDYTVKSWAEKMGLPPRIAREARG